ncbi:HEPN domain-containing protein [Sphingomonas sp. HF-S3]|uniref:HEPN domain-containing protein n=1 Tax=Sphingomonas rustica TaxID=3103142 RepID=A0ABV0BD24_9SPHN
MISLELLDGYLGQLSGLNQVVQQSHSRSIADPPDMLFYENQNIFVKSYLVSACSMLEAFIQDLATAYIDEIQERVNSANLPHNLMSWITDHEKAKMEFKAVHANKSRKDISDLISPNYWKTIKAFERVGIRLEGSGVDNFKDIIVMRVEKRNLIVHHNDDALDLSFSDISDTIIQFSNYIVCLFNAVCADPFRSAA